MGKEGKVDYKIDFSYLKDQNLKKDLCFPLFWKGWHIGVKK